MVRRIALVIALALLATVAPAAHGEIVEGRTAVIHTTVRNSAPYTFSLLVRGEGYESVNTIGVKGFHDSSWTTPFLSPGETRTYGVTVGECVTELTVTSLANGDFDVRLSAGETSVIRWGKGYRCTFQVSMVRSDAAQLDIWIDQDHQIIEPSPEYRDVPVIIIDDPDGGPGN